MCCNFSAWCESNGVRKLDGFEGRIIVDAKIGFSFIANCRLAFGRDNLFDSNHLAHADETLGQENARVGVAPVDYNGRACVFRFMAGLIQSAHRGLSLPLAARL